MLYQSQISTPQLESRQESVKDHIVELFDEMAKEESSLLERTRTQVEQYKEEIAQIRKKLEIKTDKNDDLLKKSESLLLMV